MLRTARLLVLASASLLGLGLAGCASAGGSVQRGMNCYHAGDLPCAAATFQEIEARGYPLNAKGRVRYLTYRGLTHFRLGHTDLARRLLSEASAVYQTSNPRWLPPQAVAELNQALAQLSGGAAPAGSPPPIEPTPGEPTPAEPDTIQ